MDVLVHGIEKALIRQMNKVHERALRIVFNDHITDFETLPQKSNDISSHHWNLPLITNELNTLFFQSSIR